jgi:hypothetical protein
LSNSHFKDLKFPLIDVSENSNINLKEMKNNTLIYISSLLKYPGIEVENYHGGIAYFTLPK